MQALCQIGFFRNTRLSSGGRVACAVLLGLALLVPDRSGAAEGRALRAADETLMFELKAWAAAQRPASAPDIEVIPLDSRVQVPRCEAGWAFDHPFATAEVVRARCGVPGPQFYLRTRSGPVVAGPTRSPPSAPAPDGPAPGQSSAAASAPVDNPSASRSALVARVALARGTRLTADMVELSERAGDQRSTLAILDDTLAIVDMEVTRDLRRGDVLRPTDVRPAILVRRGELVTLELANVPGLSIRARLEALHDGRRGETVKLINRESGKILIGVVSGVNHAQSR